MAAATTCIFLGPYRNLTSLTASVLSLHPNIQVFNHGGERVFNRPDLNFFQTPSSEVLSNFNSFCVDASASGEQGLFGGSILKANAYKRGQIKERYTARFGDRRVKDDIRCLVWKESQRSSFHFRDNETAFKAFLEQDDRLRFLMPVRHPLDCIYSNFISGHYTIYFTGERNSGIDSSERKEDRLKNGESSELFKNRFRSITDVVISEYHHFLNLQKEYPDKFFYFCENEFSAENLRQLSEFLKIPFDQRWSEDALSSFCVKGGYRFPAEVKSKLSEAIDRRLDEFVGFKKRVGRLIAEKEV